MESRDHQKRSLQTKQGKLNLFFTKENTMKTYSSKEVCKMFNLSAPRLLQFRKGQQVQVKSKNPSHADKVYSFDPILEENKDWFWEGSEVVFTESAIEILNSRKQYRKYATRLRSTKIPKAQTQTPKKDGFITFIDASIKLNTSVQKIYALRDVALNIPKSAKKEHILRLNKDWIFEDGKILLKVEAVEKIKAFLETRKKAQLEKNKKLTILQGKNVMIVSGEKAKKILEILQDTENDN